MRGGGEVLLRNTGDDADTSPRHWKCWRWTEGRGCPISSSACETDSAPAVLPGRGWARSCAFPRHRTFIPIVSRGTALLARWSIAPNRHGGRTIAENAAHRRRSMSASPARKFAETPGGWCKPRTSRYVLVADGLGHGLEAQTASLEAVRMLHLSPDLPPAALSGARSSGASQFARGGRRSGANRASQRHQLHSRASGIFRRRFTRARSPASIWFPSTARPAIRRSESGSSAIRGRTNGMLVLHSDGLSSSTGLETHPGLALRDPSLIAGVLYRDFGRRNDDATVVVAKAA